MVADFDRYAIASGDDEDFSHLRSLYIHVPFCRSKRVYCDFDSQPTCSRDAEVDFERYVDAVITRLDSFGRAGALSHIATVYIGGGTPTILGELLVRLVDAVMRWCHPSEFTCEANPESFTPSLAHRLRSHGVTRISLGVQSFHDNELRALGRIHSADEAERAIRLAASCGFNVSADLMCGVPLQTFESWSESLSRLIACKPNHVSVYPLSVEEGTPLDGMIADDPSLEPDEDFQASCMEIARDRLAASGYARYEVASYALSDKRCRHNISYWSGTSYLGLGRSASSMLRNSEFQALSSLFQGVVIDDKVSRVRLTQRDDAASRFEVDPLTSREAVAEDLMLACRMTDGMAPELFDAASLYIPRRALDDACARAVALGLATWTDSSADSCSRARRLIPTDRGWLEGNVLFELFWDLATGSDSIE